MYILFSVCYLYCFDCVSALYYCDIFHIWLSYDRFLDLWKLYVCM